MSGTKRGYSSITSSSLLSVESFPGAENLLQCQNMACTSHGQPEASLSCTFVPNAPFMATITCDSCDIPFTLCMRCPRAGKKTVTSEKVLAHIRQCHPACFEAHFRTRTRTGVAPAQRSARANNSGHGLVDGCHPGPDFPDNGRAALPPSQDQLPGIPPDFLDVFDYFDDNDDLLVPQVPGVRRNRNVLPLEKASDITASCRQASKDFFSAIVTARVSSTLSPRLNSARQLLIRMR
jgi:hypothetical protein